MKKHVFLTGEIQVGKSTLLRRTLEALGPLRIGGFLTVTRPDIPGAVGSVYIVPAAEAEPGYDALCRVAIRWGPGRGAEGFPEAFDCRGTEILRGAEQTQLIVMDEIGFLEAKAERFSARITELLDGDTPILGVVRQMGDTPLQSRIRSHPRARLIEVTRENRDALAETVAAYFRP